MPSRFKKWLIGRICTACAGRNEEMWAQIYEFDRNYSWEYELWEEQDQALNDACVAARKLGRSDDPADKAASLAKLLELSDSGHPFAMLSVGFRYEKGDGVEQDLRLAADYYLKSLKAGSWLARLYYASVLHKTGHQDDAIDVLAECVRNNHAPAYFWLARYRLKRDRSRKVAREVRPLLEYLSKYHHEGARMMLIALQITGFFGLREIRIGWNELRNGGKTASENKGLAAEG